MPLITRTAKGSELTIVEMDANLTYLQSLAAPAYKVYTALLTQTGTNAPVATVLENTLGGVPTYSYGGAGEYKVIHTDGFTLNKTVVFMNTALNSQTASILIDYQSNDAIHISTFDTTPQNDILFNTSIEIRVYN